MLSDTIIHGPVLTWRAFPIDEADGVKEEIHQWQSRRPLDCIRYSLIQRQNDQSEYRSNEHLSVLNAKVDCIT